MATVYLIHLDTPICHAKHYLGYTSLECVEDRMVRHKRGDGAALLQYANTLGITYNVVRTWEFPDWKSAREFERKLKRRKGSPRLCPICNQKISNLRNCNENF